MHSYLRRRPADGSRIRGDQRGFTFVAILLALLIAAALYFGYFRMQSAMRGGSTAVSAINAARAVACRTNRQNIERAVAMWSVNHPDERPSLAALEAEGSHVPTCPEGGRYELVGRAVHCSVHGE
jgi:competence protein ComGC